MLNLPTVRESVALAPFGREFVAGTVGMDLPAVPAGWLHEVIAADRLVLLRGFAPPADDQMLSFCRTLGELLEWEFGAVNELRVRPDARNYLYTNRAVPFHWDGAFAGRVPHYIFFHCEQAAPEGSGGETLFCDTTRVLAHATPQEQECWLRIQITYTTEKIVHYGGTFTAALLDRHPVSGEAVLHFAEPVADLNPVRLAVAGLPAAEQPAFLDRMHRLLNDPSFCYTHRWQTGDVLIADNHALLHGRNAFTRPAERHLRRVNIL